MNDKTKPQDDLSIEEILGSIRRIISEDEQPAEGATAAPVEEVAPVQAMPEEEPLELVNKIEPDGMITNTAPAPVETIDMVEETPSVPAEDLDEKIILMEEPVPMIDALNNTVNSDALLSSSAAESTTAVMAKLARHTALLENNTHSSVGGVTIEGLVREMLKPMLREWLDSHLPDMVQKMVEREIQRLTKNL
jgi:uncharacterized protein